MKSSTAYIRQLVKDINTGKIGIPVFQRNFVWKPEQVLDLFDSIYKGYPVGTILLWAPIEPVLCKDILTDNVLELNNSPFYYVLDGRQRLTTFFGCISPQPDKPEIFKVAYNLKTDLFEYSKRHDPLSIQISDLFDTFVMLGKLQEIISNDSYSGKVQLYADRAKQINSILQEYMVNQVSLEHCSLEEASIVFSRINSKGTDISRASMLQAVTYKEGGHLLTNAIEDIRKALIPYDFEDLSEDDILNCFFRFEGKKFYDLSMKEMESLNLLQHEDKVKSTIVSAVKFLHDECGVLSSSLLPYSRQLIALTWLFMDFPELTSRQIKEAKKWFDYTTSQQVFQNGSLKNIRKIFNRWDMYLKGEAVGAYDYEEWHVPDNLDFRFGRKSARANFMLLSLISAYRKHSTREKGDNYLGHIHVGASHPACYFVLMRYDDKTIIHHLLHDSDCNLLEYQKELKRHCLTPQIVQSYRDGDLDGFIAGRMSLILDYQKQQLEQYTKSSSNVTMPNWQKFMQAYNLEDCELENTYSQLIGDMNSCAITDPTPLASVVYMLCSLDKRGVKKLDTSVLDSIKACVSTMFKKCSTREDLYDCWLEYVQSITLYIGHNKLGTAFEDVAVFFNSIYQDRWQKLKDKMTIALENLSNSTINEPIALLESALPDHSCTYSMVDIFDKVDIDKMFLAISFLDNMSRNRFRLFFTERYKLVYRLQQGNTSYRFEKDIHGLELLADRLRIKGFNSSGLERESYTSLWERVNASIERCKGSLDAFVQ